MLYPQSTHLRKNLDQMLALQPEPEINPNHTKTWLICNSKAAYLKLKKEYPRERMGNFNIHAACTAPTTIRFRQRETDFDGGKKGDYTFLDRSGGRMHIPFIIVKRLFL